MQHALYTDAFYAMTKASRPARYVSGSIDGWKADRSTIEHYLCECTGVAFYVGIVVWQPNTPLWPGCEETHTASVYVRRIRVPALIDEAERLAEYQAISARLAAKGLPAREPEELAAEVRRQAEEYAAGRAAAVAAVLAALDEAERATVVAEAA